MDLRPKHKCIIALLLLVSFVLLCGCTEVRAQADVTEEAAGSGAAPHIAVKIEGDNISRVMSSMTLREKIGQLFIIRPDTLGGSVQNLTKEGMALYTSYPAGGFCLFARNIADPQQLKSFTSQLHGLGDRFQPILTIDEEGGPVVRIAANSQFDVPRFPAMGKLTAAGDPPEVRRLASFECSKAIGSYLKEYGFDLDFAPVADVNTNPHNPVIGTRAYSNDPLTAADLVGAACAGLHEGGSGSCLKHWPGHGDTKTDTHKGRASTAKTWEEILDCEAIPFRAGIDAGTDMVMVSHIAAPAVTGSDEPASLSHVLITEKLRRELGYEGVVITDTLDMGAVSHYYSPGEAAVQAFLAGADILLMPSDYFEAFDAMVAAVNDGTIPKERLDESVRRILQLRLSLAALSQNSL